MKTIVYCKTVAKDTLGLFAKIGDKEYFLFNQSYRKSIKEYFYNGVCVDNINNYSSAHSCAVRKIMDKLPAYIRYIEKEYDVAIYEKTKETRSSKKSKPYKRQAFRWQDHCYNIAT